MNAAIRGSAASLRAWMDWLGETLPEVTETERLCLHGREMFLNRTDLGYLLFLRGTDAFVGRCGLHKADWSVPSFMLGYWVNRQYEGQGYITESARALVALAFRALHANRVWLSCSPFNLRSRRVAERVGFRLEGELRNERRMPDGSLRDTLMYGMTTADHEALAG